MRLLVSPTNLDEARLLVDCGVHIIDVKNPAEGSLGAPFPSVVRDIVDYATSYKVPVSATLGDLPFKPGTAGLAAYGLAHLGVKYVKAGLHGPRTYREATELLNAICESVAMVDSSITVVAAGYADYRAFGGLAPNDLVQAAAATSCTAVMLDTLDKRAGNLFECMTELELRAFVQSAQSAALLVALAGSICQSHLPALARLTPNIIGIRGALCAGGDRQQRIDERLLHEFLHSAQADIPATHLPTPN